MQIGGIYTIDFAKVSKMPKFNVNIKNGDDKRTIKLILLKNNEVLNLKNYTVVVAAKKSDGTDIFNDVKIIDAANGLCEVEISEQMLALGTDLPCEIILYGLDRSVSSSSNFIISVLPSVKDAKNIVSSNEFKALTNAIGKVNEWNEYFEKTSNKIEEKYTERLNAIENEEVIKDIKQKKTLITLGSDDGWLEDYTIVKPILDKYNYPMSVALVPGFLSNNFTQYISEEQAKEMVDSGWEVVNHSINNEMLGEIPFSKAKYYIDQCHKELTKKGFDVKGIVYPQGSFNDEVLNYVKSIYNYGVSIIPNYEDSPTNTYFLNRWHFDDANTTFEYYKNIIDKCEGKWTIFMLHGKYFRTNPELIPVLEQLVEYIHSKGYECVTYSKGLELYKNTVFAGNEKKCTKIGVDGSFYSDDILENFTNDKFINQNTPISYFQNDKKTIKVFTTLDNVAFPEGAVGYLETYRFSKHEDLSFQIWHPAYKDKIYKRIWSTSLKKWLDFKDITLEYTIPVTTTDITTTEGKLQIRNKGQDKANELTVCIKNAYNTPVHTKVVTLNDTSLYVRNSLLTPSEEHRGKQVLIQADGVEDKLYICVRRSDGNYHWKQVQFI